MIEPEGERYVVAAAQTGARLAARAGAQPALVTVLTDTDERFLNEGVRRLMPQWKASDWSGWSAKSARGVTPGADVRPSGAALSDFRLHLARQEIARSCDVPSAPPPSSAAWLGAGNFSARGASAPAPAPSTAARGGGSASARGVLGPVDSTTGKRPQLHVVKHPQGRRVVVKPVDAFALPAPITSVAVVRAGDGDAPAAEGFGSMSASEIWG